MEGIKGSLQGGVKLASTWRICLQADLYIKQPLCDGPAGDSQTFAIT